MTSNDTLSVRIKYAIDVLESKGRPINTANVREATLLTNDDFTNGLDNLIQSHVNSSMANTRKSGITDNSYYHWDGRQQKLSDIMGQPHGAYIVHHIADANANKGNGLLRTAKLLREYANTDTNKGTLLSLSFAPTKGTVKA